MNAKVLLVVLGFAALAYARPGSFESFESFESGEGKYDFNWAVRDESSENDFGHQEARDGESTKGSYYVRLPDGRLQTVKYFVEGDSGYVAEVNYDGEARFPTPTPTSPTNPNKRLADASRFYFRLPI
ncbi:pro-resilin-like [Macrobrachium rosenbergii]|uniref:pro-resilin-like n=1 Tax=Macrobrachium rosenbergii TaxID=79674 RepID=UPI0034D5B2C9